MIAATDEQLMADVQAGDVDAFNALYERHAARALRVARGLCGDFELAADAVQEAFLAVWQKREKFSPRHGAFRSWVMAIVRHRTIDLIRKRAAGVEQTTMRDDVIEALFTQRGGFADVSAQRLELDGVRSALADLPRDQREALVLAFFGGLSHSEIAAHCDLPLGTVKGRIRIGLDKLSTSLDPELALAS